MRRLALGAAGLVVAALAAAKLAVRERAGEDKDEIDLAAVMEGRKVRMRARPFQGGTLLVAAAALELDLRRVVPAPTGIELSVLIVGGALRLVVPPEWKVEHEVARRVAMLQAGTGAAGEDDPALRITGSAWFSRLEVVVRPTMTAVAS